MIKHEVTQGEEEWFRLRLGIPTASEFSKIITPARGDFSAQADDYANLKIAEIMTGEQQGIFQPTYWMERGQLLEVEARESYEFMNDCKVERGGFITTDDAAFGCSPDGLIDDGEGMLEIKCLMAKSQVEYLLGEDIKTEHKPQIQGQLKVAERSYVDYWMYHPDMPRVAVRQERDDAYIARMDKALEKFRDLMGEKIIKLQQLGRWQVLGSVSTALVPDELKGGK